MLMAAMALSGCGNSTTPDTLDPSLPEGYEPSSTPITFRTEDNWGDPAKTQTRGFETNEINFREFGVLSYYLKNGASIEDTSPNFMYNQRVSKNIDDEWSYSPVKYWPNNDGDRLQFFALHPYGDAETVIVDKDVEGYPTFTVTPAAKPYDQDDLVVASSGEMKKGDGRVKLSFTHKQAQARVYAAHCGDSDTTTKLKIRRINITGFRASGKLVYDESITEADKFVWEHQQGTEVAPAEDSIATYNFDSKELDPKVNVPYLATATNDSKKYSALDYNGQGESNMMLIPQDVIGDIHFVVLFSYEVNKNTVQAFQEFMLPAGSTLKEGEIKIYLLLIDPTNVGFGTINVVSEPWTDVDINGGDQFEIE